MPLPTLEQRIQFILDHAAQEIRPCKACQAMLYFVVNPKTGKKIPYTAEGVSHFVDCPHAESFRRQRGAK